MTLALVLLATLPAATLSLEYRLDEPSGNLTIAWSTSTASGRLSRQLTPEDTAALKGLAVAVASPGAAWQALSNRAADLLLSGIEPLGGVKRVIVSAPDEPLRGIPFEVLGSPPLIERFTVWYTAPSPASISRLWPVPEEVAAAFVQRYNRELRIGLTPGEALRRAKIESIQSGGGNSHPFYWATFVLRGDGASESPWVIPWLWIAGLALVLASAGFFIWWRRQRFEVW